MAAGPQPSEVFGLFDLEVYLQELFELLDEVKFV